MKEVPLQAKIQKNLTNIILREHRQFIFFFLNTDNLKKLSNPLPVGYLDYSQGNYLNTINTTPETCQGLLVAQEACSWVKVQGLLTLPQGPVTLQLNPVGLLKSFWGWGSPASGKLKRAMTSELHIWWLQDSGFSCDRINYTSSILPSLGNVIPH